LSLPAALSCRNSTDTDYEVFPDLFRVVYA